MTSATGYRDRWRRLVSGEGSGLLRLALSLASIPYGIVVALRCWAFDVGLKQVRRLPRPVVSVGNLTVGGTGKTPLVEALARRLGEDRKIVILMRGYAAGPEGSDEVHLLGENLPSVRICPGPDRVRQGRLALEEGEVDLFLLDDGFQHRRLHRDLDIVAVDAICPFGYGRLLPRGMLREPMGSFRRAGLVAITRVNQVSPEEVREIRRRIETVAPGLDVVEFLVTSTLVRPDGEEDAASRPLEGAEVIPFCGIGNPESFARSLREMGSDAEPVCFPDHHAYTRGDVSLLDAKADAKEAVALVTTQKDAHKVRLHSPAHPLWVVRVRAEAGEGVEILDRRLSQIGKTEMLT
jgi:tetraacyldisaccharide 4'-kinase